MCIDIINHEKSEGKRGILDLMHKLSNEYGVTKAFDDKELFDKIVSLTYPEVGDFLKTYVSGATPIPYDLFLNKVGVSKSTVKVPGGIFLKGQRPYITINPQTNEIVILPNIELNEFFKALSLKGGDIIVAINGKNFNKENIFELITTSQNWKENETISLKIKRNGKEDTINGKVALPYEEKETFSAKDTSKNTLKEAWLKG